MGRMKKVDRGRPYSAMCMCSGNDPVYINDTYHYPADPPFKVTYWITPDENGEYPECLEDVLPPSVEYFGPCEGHIEPRDAAIPLQPMAPGEGSPQMTLPDRATRLLSAFQMLDPSNNAHWTRTGKPRLAALGQFMGDRVTDTDVEEHLNKMGRPAQHDGDTTE